MDLMRAPGKATAGALALQKLVSIRAIFWSAETKFQLSGRQGLPKHVLFLFMIGGF